MTVLVKISSLRGSPGMICSFHSCKSHQRLGQLQSSCGSFGHNSLPRRNKHGLMSTAGSEELVEITPRTAFHSTLHAPNRPVVAVGESLNLADDVLASRAFFPSTSSFHRPRWRLSSTFAQPSKRSLPRLPDASVAGNADANGQMGSCRSWPFAPA